MMYTRLELMNDHINYSLLQEEEDKEQRGFSVLFFIIVLCLTSSSFHGRT